MATSYSPRIVTNGLVLSLDAANIKSFRGEPTTNVFTHYGTPGEGSSGDVNVTFSIQGTGTFIRLGYNQNYGGYIIQPGDVVYRYNLGTSGCHYHGNAVSIPAGSYATFSFDYYVSPETTIEDSYLANFENYGGGAFGGSVAANGLKGVWQRTSFTAGPASSNGTLAMFLYPGGCSPSRFGDTGYILYKNPQVEFKSYSTPFVNGTRGTTVATGGGWADLSGNDNHGELVNGITFNGSNRGNLVFDGVDDYIAVSNSQTLNPGSNSFSINFWVKQNSNVFNGLVEARANSLHGFLCGVNYAGGYASMFLNTTTDGDQNVYSSTVATFGTIGVWMNVCIVVNRTSATIEFYLNGVKQGNSVSITSGGTTDPGGGYKYWIGGDLGGPEANASFAMAQHYNRALTSAEVLQNFNASRARFGI